VDYPGPLDWLVLVCYLFFLMMGMMVKKIGWTALSAGLCVLIFEPFAWWPLALVAWLPFLFVLKTASPREGFYLGLFHGLLLFGGTLSWMWNIFGRASIALWAIVAIFTAMTALLIVRLPTKSKWQGAVLVAAVWAGVEYFRAEVFTLTFPWITPGTGVPPNWLTPIVGVYGITFCVVLGNALLLTRWKQGLAILLFLGLAVLTFSEAPDPEDKIRVGLVQDESAIIRQLKEASEPILDKVDAVVWPEYSLGRFEESTLEVGRGIAAQTGLFVASGLEEIDGQDHNTAFVISAAGIEGRHVKNHPVHFFTDGVAGKLAEPVATQLGKVGTPVCFDCDHQDVIRKMTAKGAEFFLIPSLDAMAWSARQHEQHGALFQHRAAENGRWLAVASSSGVTQIIDPRGQVRARLPLMAEGILVGEIGRTDQRTVFQWGGWLLGPAMMGVTGVAILWLIRRKYSKLA